jgi:hypothetical protein
MGTRWWTKRSDGEFPGSKSSAPERSAGVSVAAHGKRIKWDSPGPAFSAPELIRKDGGPGRLLKFRSMLHGARISDP